MGFFNDLMGKTSAKAAEQLGQRNAAEIGRGYDAADTASKTGFDQSMQYYRPYAEGGQRGQTAYENTLGLNGQAARQQQFDEGYNQDPALAQRNQNNLLQMNSLLRKYNAGPQGVNSGAATLGAGRLATEQFNNDWGGYQNRLQGLGQQGFQAAGQQAGLTTGYYGGVADRSVGRSTALVGNDTQATQAANNARMSGVNNLLSIFGTAAGVGTRLATGGMGGSGGASKPNPYTASGGGW